MTRDIACRRVWASFQKRRYFAQVSTIREASWEQVQALRVTLDASVADAPDLAHAAQRFVAGFTQAYASVVLARMFIVTPFAQLPDTEQRVASAFAAAAQRALPLAPTTPVLTLLGTAGREPGWNRRESSAGHRAIPLVDRALVHGAPMIAALLGSLDVDLAKLRRDPAVQLRSLAGGLNARFYVPDAPTTVDADGRFIIGAREFVAGYGIQTVFGMGGTYVNGLLVATILFTTESLDAATVDRFPSFIGTFKIATSKLAEQGRLFP